MRAVVYFDPPSRRSRGMATYMAMGIGKTGDTVYQTGTWKFDPEADVGIAYGWGHPELFDQYRAAGKHFVYIDLGWWWRKPEGMVMEGFHKVVVDGREPTAYFRKRPRPGDRFARFKLPIRPWRTTGDHILLAGMSAKSAGTRGFDPYEWEVNMIEQIRRVTDRPILYRPKPSWPDARPIPGVAYSSPDEPVEKALENCWAVVTLHSNVAIDGLLAGIPAYADQGVATDLSLPFLDLPHPPLPDGREQLMNDIAYAQWSSQEMRTGECWQFLKKETPLCTS